MSAQGRSTRIPRQARGNGRSTISSGSPGDADIFGSQQYGPLLGIEVPED